MKNRTKIVLASTIAIITAVTVVGIQQSNSQPANSTSPAVSIIQDTPTASRIEDTQPTIQTAPTSTKAPAQETSPTPDENKAKIMSVITDYADRVKFPDMVTEAQTTCFDDIFVSNKMYDDYDSLINYPPMEKFLAGTEAFDGPTTCRFQEIPKTVQQKLKQDNVE